MSLNGNGYHGMQIEKLAGRSNFATWKFAVQTYMEHEELWECVTGAETDKKKNLKAKSKLILLCDPSVYVHIEEATSAQQVWNCITKAYDDSGLTRKVGLLRDLITTNLDGCQNIEEYVYKIMSTAHKLRNINFKVDDEWLGTLLLAGLPDQYKPMIMALESSGVAISSDSVKTKLLQEVKKDSVALYVNKNQALKQNKSKGPRCFICNKHGHIAKYCRNKKAGNKSDNNANFIAVLSATQQNYDGWFIDSGASMHMTKHREWVYDETCPPISSIKVANDKVLPVTSSGSVDIQLPSGQKIKVTNVLYVPELATNLLSVSQMIKKGCQVKFDSQGCKIFNQKNIEVATAKLSNNMYRLNTKSSEAYISVINENDSYLWHQRMGHLNFFDLKKLPSCTEGIPMIEKLDKVICISCLEGKQSRQKFPCEGSRADGLLKIIHSDICGPMEVRSIGGARYFVTFIDDYSRKVHVYIMKNKSDVVEKFQEYKANVQNQLNAKIKILRTDNGTEYLSNSFSNILKDSGISHQTTNPYTPEQNGLAERANRTLVEKARCMLINANLQKQYWAEAVSTAAYLINRSPTRTLEYSTPEEIWSGKKPDVSHLKIFGCEVMVHVPKEKTRKWDSKARKMIFIGYCENTKGYKVIDPKTRSATRSRDVVFLESSVKRNFASMPLTVSESDFKSKTEESVVQDQSMKSESTEADKSVTTLSDDSFYSEEGSPYKRSEEPHPNVTTRLKNVVKNQSMKLESTEADMSVAEQSDDVMGVMPRDGDDEKRSPIKNSQETHPNVTTRLKNVKSNKTKESYFCSHEDTVLIPETYQEAKNSPEAHQWQQSIEEELNAHEKNRTWELVEKPQGAKVIGCKWVFRTKDLKSGTLYKARLCAKGCAQKKGIDYNETFSPTVRYDSIRIVLSEVAQHNLEMVQFDVKTAFLYGDIQENIYMKPPEGLKVPEINNVVCKLNRSLYGLKQAPRCWNNKFDSTLKQYGFVNSYADRCVYTASINHKKTYLLLFVDDGLLISDDISIMNKIIKSLKENFDIKLCEPHNFVGLQIERTNGGLFVHQQKYVEQVLIKFDLCNANSNHIPVDPHTRLERAEQAEDKSIPYREAVGSLMHLAIVSRPDIMFAVSMVSRYLNCYDHTHYAVVKKIMKYLKETKDYGLNYTSMMQHQVEGYSDADYANDTTTRRSMTGYVFMKNGAAVTWASQRQASVALSTTEAEFMAACAATKEAMWIRQLLKDIGEYKQNLICLNIDNQSAICVIKNVDYHKRCKHIEVRYNFVKERYVDKQIDLNYICTNEQNADIFTKALPKDRFQYLRTKLGVCKMK